MPFNIIPRKGLDRVRFGEGRMDTRARLGQFVTFHRTPEGAPVDHYVKLGLMLSFDSSDRVEFIELAEPAEILFGNVSLLGHSYRRVVSELWRIGVVGTEDDFGVEFRDQCFSLFSQTPGEDDSQVEGVSVFAPGYYG
ncbi:hypothetical protein AMK17_34810 [Streptomyces sp. CB00072]|uniref:hypothetical protein n=1 Tax=Streptomyces sp. CB00072 TaxID=1703928 RepID=UPI00093CD78A|nr:hypothetical protein [Streptomyces sp. CB00072]OKI50580.1 hypothetical protein AMK17_34810 [Streptomyces sp. CB00072]